MQEGERGRHGEEEMDEGFGNDEEKEEMKRRIKKM